MKKHLKVLLALLLAVVCIITCISCGNDKGDEDLNDGPGSDGTGTTVVEDTYKISFVYSYTTKIVNEYGRPKTVKEKISVKTVEVAKDNNGLTDAQREEIAAILYHGYGFADWYEEKDWIIDKAQNDNQYPNPDSTPYDFTAKTPITTDITLYGDKSDIAGRDLAWEIEEVFETNNRGDQTLVDVVLKITGNGAMFDYENTNAIDIPWYGYSVKQDVLDDSGNPVMDGDSVKQEEIRNFEDITKIFIGSGVTSIGRNAFRGLTGVTAIEFEDNSKLSYISESAFKETTSLKSLETPSLLTTIEKNAFENSGLTSVSFNDGLVTIADSAFSGAKGISWILLPSTVKTIGVAAFHPGVGASNSAHSLSKVYYTGKAPTDGSSIFGTAIDTGMDNAALTSKATVYYYLEYNKDTAASVRDASWYYFNYKDDDGNDQVQPMAYCLTLKYYLPSSPISASWVDYVPATPTLETGKNGTKTYKLVGKLDQANVDYREDNIVYHGYKFATYGDEGKYTLNGAKSDFCVGAKVTDNMTCSLGRGKILSEGGGVIFSYSSGNLSISLDTAAIKEGASDKIWNFTNGEDTTALWTDNSATIKNIANINISEGITYIGTLTFNNLISVPSIVVPSTVKGIAVNAFEACTNLRSIYYGGELTECALYDANGNPTGKTLADATEFSNFSKIVFYQYAASSTDADGSYWTDVDGKYLAWTLTTDETTGNKSLYVAGDAKMVDFAHEKAAPWYSETVVDKLTSVTFADNILTIGENVLHGYENVGTINLSNNITRIPESAFAGTALLNNTSAYDGGVLVLGGSGSGKGTLLVKVDSRRKNSATFEISFGITLVAGGAFNGCDKIEEIVVPSTVRNINDNAFAEMTLLNVIYTEALTSAWKNASAESGYNSNVYVCGYDDYDINGNKNTSERLWYRDGKTGEVKLKDGFCLGCYDSNGHTTHESNDSTCKHYWGEWFVKQLPTHTMNGVMARQCTKPGCNALDYDKETLEKKSDKVNGQYVHTYGEYILDDVSYCEQNRTKSAKCLYCTERDVITIPGTMIGSHSFGEYIADFDSATCYSVGTKTAMCQNPYCTATDVVADDTQPKKDHVFGTATCKNNADCLKDFNYYIKCINDGCGYQELDRTVPNDDIQPHTWTNKVADKYIYLRATVDSSNVYYKSCSKCGVSCQEFTDVEEKTFVDVGTQLKVYEWDNDVLSKIFSSSGKYDIISNLDKYHYATVVKYGARLVLELGKNSGAADAVLNIKNPNVLVTTGIVTHEFTTEIKIGAVEGVVDYVYRLGFSNGTESVFNMYFILNGNTVTVKDGYAVDSKVFGSFNINSFANIGLTGTSELMSEEIDETPVIDPNDPNYDPNNPPAKVIRTAYYYLVNVTVGSTSTEHKIYVDPANLVTFDRIANLESEINPGLDSARIYLEDTYIRSISADAAEVDENKTPDPDDGTGDGTGGDTGDGTGGDEEKPTYSFAEDYTKVDDKDAHVENPADGITVTIKDGKKDEYGYVYVQSNVTAGMLNVLTFTNEKVSDDGKGFAFTSSTVFDIAGDASGSANKLFVFDSNITIAAGTHKLVFANSTLSLHSFALDMYITSDGLVIADPKDYPGLDGETGKVTVAGINSATEFNLRVELYRVTTKDGEKLVAKIYVNDVYVGMSDAAAISKNKVQTYDIEAVAIYHDATVDGSITFNGVKGIYATVTNEKVVYVPEVLE